MSHRRIAVTGAAGFVGSNLCRHLRSDGVEVRGVDPRPPPADVDWFEGDILDEDILGRAFDGADAVVHLAARVHVMRESSVDPLAEFRRVNVEGTRRVLAAAIRGGVKRLVFLSSIAAVCQESSIPVDENTPPCPSTPYGTSKLEAEAEVLHADAKGSIEGVVLRPPMAYGPGMRGNPLRLFKTVAAGIPLPIASIHNRRTFVYIGNLVSAIRRVIEVPAPTHPKYCVADHESLSTPEFARRVARAMNRPARLVKFPVSYLWALGYVGDRVPRSIPFPVRSSVVRSLTTSLEVASTLIAETAGFIPPFDVDDGLRVTAQWCQGSGHSKG